MQPELCVKLLGILVLAATGAVAAQAPTPGTIRERLKSPPLTAPKGALPESPAVEQFRPGVPAGGPEIPVSRFEITGNETLPTAELLGVIEGSEGKKLTLFEIYDLADRLTDHYRKAGYVLAEVIVPAQKVSSGTVRFEVIEGRIGVLRFEGNDSYSDEFLSRRLDEVVPGDPLRSEPLERQLLLINDLPGITARAVVTPGTELGASDILVRSQERRFEGDIRLNNYGRRAVGEGRIEGNARVNNPLHRGDRLELSAIWAQGAALQYGAASYSFPVTTKGTRVTLSASRFLFDVMTEKLGAGLQDQQLTGSGDDYRLAVSHPLRRSRRRNFTVGAALERLQSHQGPGPPLALPPVDRSLNLLEVSARADLVHASNAVTTASAVFSTNFRNQPRAGTRNNAQPGRLQLDVSHLYPFGDGWSLFARGRGVASLDPLMDLTKFRLGGPGDLRGFPSGEVSGDHGFALTLQLNRRSDLHEKIPTVWRVFADAGKVYRQGPVTFPTHRTDSLTDVGLGLTANVAKRFTLDVDVVFPTNSRRISDGREAGRIWAQLVASF